MKESKIEEKEIPKTEPENWDIPETQTKPIENETKINEIEVAPVENETKINETEVALVETATEINETEEAHFDNGYQRLTKLFVGGLPFGSGDDALYNYFSQFGEIVEAVVIRGHFNQASKGYGFVTLKDPQSAAMALRNPNPYIDGRRCNVNFAYKNSKKRERQYYDSNYQAYMVAAPVQPQYMQYGQMFNLDPRYAPAFAYCPILPDPSMLNTNVRPRYDNQMATFPQYDQYGHLLNQPIGPIFPFGMGIASTTPYGSFFYPSYAPNYHQSANFETYPTQEESSYQEQLTDEMKHLSLEKVENIPEEKQPTENIPEVHTEPKKPLENNTEYEMEIREKELVEAQKWRNKYGDKPRPSDQIMYEDFPPLNNLYSPKKSKKNVKHPKSTKKDPGSTS